ncbi:MAG TPA: CGNR zinc finger domain-containing protein [Pseudonocardiaceae bacterium]|nr:CGNR zinc finger domain-containing protein [Pseudonocardiaceae bacterium]
MTTTAPLLGEPLPVELMNTVWADRDGVHDALTEVSDLAGWLSAKGLPHTEPSLDGFRALRDALRVLAAEVTDDTRPIADPGRDVRRAVDTLNTLCAATPSWSRLNWSTSRAERVSAGDPALSEVAEAAAAFFGSVRGAELRACYAPGCVLYFVRDHPRRQWCSAGCGNRARVARHYAKHHTPG